MSVPLQQKLGDANRFLMVPNSISAGDGAQNIRFRIIFPSFFNVRLSIPLRYVFSLNETQAFSRSELVHSLKYLTVRSFALLSTRNFTYRAPR